MFFADDLLLVLERNTNLDIILAIFIIWCHIVYHIVLVHEKVAEVPSLLVSVHGSEYSNVAFVAISVAEVLGWDQHIFAINLIVDALACVEETDLHADLILPRIFGTWGLEFADIIGVAADWSTDNIIQLLPKLGEIVIWDIQERQLRLERNESISSYLDSLVSDKKAVGSKGPGIHRSSLEQPQLMPFLDSTLVIAAKFDKT